eukprot:TRINITY_DN17764_c0_g1_i1.p1 TRINITY_DN17764_c0_g1~~TRINITY_DN17764_c0_g1_i1.p1  ORF type:complete len:118 (-),score=2.71 TRINITY_DN17764_c0_g1_i1:9-362(-)
MKLHFALARVVMVLIFQECDSRKLDIFHSSYLVIQMLAFRSVTGAIIFCASSFFAPPQLQLSFSLPPSQSDHSSPPKKQLVLFVFSAIRSFLASANLSFLRIGRRRFRSVACASMLC